MHILANVGPKVNILTSTHFQLRVCHFLVCVKEKGDPRPKMTKCDMGEEIKKLDFLSDILSEWAASHIHFFCTISQDANVWPTLL